MRWYRTSYDSIRDRHYMETPKVYLVCPCGDRAASIQDALKHRTDHHVPGLYSIRMLIDQTFKWKYDQHIRRPGDPRFMALNVTLSNREAYFLCRT